MKPKSNTDMLTVQVEAKECPGCGKAILRCHYKASRWPSVKYCGLYCSAKAKKAQPTAPWRNETKTCVVCGNSFKPFWFTKKTEWLDRDTCSFTCFNKSWAGSTIVSTAIDPSTCVTKGQRLKFLRLSESACGGKQPISITAFQRISRMSDRTIKNIESDKHVIMEWEKLACAALKVPVTILTIPLDKWLAVVNKAKLTAVEVVKMKPKTEPK